LRFNIDPQGNHSDDEIFEALRRVHLITTAEQDAAYAGTLSTLNINIFLTLDNEVTEGGSNLSQGQRYAKIFCPRDILSEQATGMHGACIVKSSEGSTLG